MQSMRTAVPGIDSSANLNMADVIGNKEDTHAGDSLFAHAVNTNEHFHTACMVYPTLANGVAVATDAGGWALGSFVEIVPVNTIVLPFDIHWISVEALDDVTVYEIVLYAVEVEIGHVRVTKNANLDATMNIPFQCPILDANVQIQAKTASAAGNSVATISIFYHVY